MVKYIFFHVLQLILFNFNCVYGSSLELTRSDLDVIYKKAVSVLAKGIRDYQAGHGRMQVEDNINYIYDLTIAAFVAYYNKECPGQTVIYVEDLKLKEKFEKAISLVPNNFKQEQFLDSIMLKAEKENICLWLVYRLCENAVERRYFRILYYNKFVKMERSIVQNVLRNLFLKEFNANYHRQIISMWHQSKLEFNDLIASDGFVKVKKVNKALLNILLFNSEIKQHPLLDEFLNYYNDICTANSLDLLSFLLPTNYFDITMTSLVDYEKRVLMDRPSIIIDFLARKLYLDIADRDLEAAMWEAVDSRVCNYLQSFAGCNSLLRSLIFDQSCKEKDLFVIDFDQP